MDFDYMFSAWWFAIAQGLLTAFCAALAVSFAVGCFGWLLDKGHRSAFRQNTVAVGFAALALGFLGWVVGYLTGMSREPAVAQVLPAVLGAVAGFAGFVAVKYDKSAGVAMLVLPFAFCLFVGSSTSAKLHMIHPERPDESLPSIDFLKTEALKEDAIKRYRAALGLPWPPDPNPYLEHSSAGGKAEKVEKAEKSEKRADAKAQD